MPARWDGDNRGAGVGDATPLVPGVLELVGAFKQPTWVAEQPEIHLRPHIEAWCDQDQRVALSDAHTDHRHAFILDLQWRGAPASVGEARATVFSLIGSFAESATYVRQRRLASDGGRSPILQFQVGTGEVAPDTRFEPHGHVVVIDVTGVL